MAGPVSQTESDLIYRRLASVCVSLQGAYEEVKRLDSLKTTQDLGTNLDEPSHGLVTKTQAVDLFTGFLADFIAMYEGGNLNAGPNRRTEADHFLAIASQIGA
jgi:hypothetical protein